MERNYAEVEDWRKMAKQKEIDTIVHLLLHATKRTFMMHAKAVKLIKFIYECNIMQWLVCVAVCQSFAVWNLLLVGNFLCKYFINCLLKVTISECRTKRNEENNCIKQLTERNVARGEIVKGGRSREERKTIRLGKRIIVWNRKISAGKGWRVTVY